MSKLIETRAEFQALAETRLEEAKTLLDQSKWDGAYYLAGYAVELALKACIIKKLMATDAFPGKDLSKDCYTHAFDNLLRAAKLEAVWQIAIQSDSAFEANWWKANEWSEVTRYHRIDEPEARGLFEAITEAAHGVLAWIQTHW